MWANGGFGPATIMSMQDPTGKQVYWGEGQDAMPLGAYDQIYFVPAMTGTYTLICTTPPRRLTL